MKEGVILMKVLKGLILMIIFIMCVSCVSNSGEFEHRVYMTILEEKNQYSLLLEIETLYEFSHNPKVFTDGTQTPFISPSVWHENFSVTDILSPIYSRLSLIENDKKESYNKPDKIYYKLKISEISENEILIKGILYIATIEFIPINQTVKIYKRVLIHSCNSVSGINNDK